MLRSQAEARARALVDQMTLYEAATQIRFNSPAIEHLGIPEYNWWNEGLHGVARAGTATSFPQAIGLAATFDPALMREVAGAIATEGRAIYNENGRHGDRDIYKGLTYWSPNVNIFRDPRWGRGQETYGEDPYLTGQLAVAFIEGLQGEDDGVPYMKLAACAKHYAVHSGPEALRHSFDAQVSDKDLWETYLPAFEACVKAGGVEAVMGAYNRVNGQPCCAHPRLIGQILRGEWGFAGHFVTDCWAVMDFHLHHRVTEDAAQSAALALKMGSDLNCGCAYEHIMKAYDRGEVSEQDIRRAVVRLYTTRFLLGMFDQTPYDDIPYEAVECSAHLALARRAAKRSLVLLKNDGLLPLDLHNIRTVGVVGPNANSRSALVGNYYGTASRYVTVLEGIQNLVGDAARVLYSEGCHLYLEKPDPLSHPNHRLCEAAIVAEHSDVVIVCLGLDEHLEGEEGDQGNQYASGDKEGLALPRSQMKLLHTVAATGKPFAVVMMTGSCVDMNFIDRRANALIQAWYPGAQGGQAVADALFGVAAPCGKLPITIYRDLQDMPEFTDYAMTNRTYRHLSRPPLYPFGYGLGYGRCALLSAQASPPFAAAQMEGATVTALVQNQGPREVSEVVQVYARVLGTANEVKNHRLCGFCRVDLAPGEEKRLTIHLPARAFETVNASGARVKEGSGALLYVGFGQPDQRTVELTGQKPIQIRL